MLLKIECDSFKHKKIIFSPGLNVILGDEIGSNSIGKSTFLMIVDFVFGGDDYVSLSSDVIRNLGNHEIKFCFEFSNKKYYFLRYTADFQNVRKCDEKYKEVSSVKIDEFREFLKKSYEISLYKTSFREVIGRFARVYGKSNLDEKNPLHHHKQEAEEKAVNALIKLFDLYKEIDEIDQSYKDISNELKTLKSAKKLNYLPSISKTDYQKNHKVIEKLNIERKSIASGLESNLLEMDSLKAEEILKSKKELSIARRRLTRLKSERENIEECKGSNRKIKKADFEDLLHFFPDANIKSLEKVERFHVGISSILKDEFNKKRKELDILIEISETQINDIENELKALLENNKLSKVVLNKYASIQKEIEYRAKENEYYDKENKIAQSKKTQKAQKDLIRNEQLKKIESSMNSKIKEINDFIYSEAKKEPIISLESSKYSFVTIDDTGTGTSYKSMVALDLAILELTQLPILLHDSVVLKQISDIAIENILLKYKASGKQVFISLDKLDSYSEGSQKILNESRVLELAPNGNELFGKSWSDK